MQVALLANTSWLDEELALFRHLVVGLIDEQVRVVQVVPDALDEQDSVAFGQRINWRDSRWSPIRRHRVASLAEQLKSMNIDVVHALDGRLWKGAYDLAESLGCAAVFGSASRLDLTQLSWLHRRLDVSRMAMAPATEPLANTMRQTLSPQAMIELIPAAAYVSNDRQHDQRFSRPAENPEALCAVISGEAQSDADYEAMFEALARLFEEYPQMQCFVDNMGLSQHELWRSAQRYGLLGNLSFIPRRLGHRELLLRADVLIHPQALGRSRCLTLNAMAGGMPVIAREDSWLDYLIDDQTAWVVDQSNAQAWLTRFRQLFNQPQQALELGRRAQQWIEENRPVSRQVDQYRLLYHRVTGQGIKLPGA